MNNTDKKPLDIQPLNMLESIMQQIKDRGEVVEALFCVCRTASGKRATGITYPTIKAALQRNDFTIYGLQYIPL